MGVTTAVPLGSLYNMSKFALEGLTEGLYYELKPLNIELRLIEQGGSTDNNIICNTNREITAYDGITGKLKHLFETLDNSMKDDTLDIVKVIAGLANRESNKFRTVIGNAGNSLLALQNLVPIEDYLETIAANFK